jgi:hypothetical protein
LGSRYVDRICFVNVGFGGKRNVTDETSGSIRELSLRGKVGADAARHEVARNNIFFNAILALRRSN